MHAVLFREGPREALGHGAEWRGGDLKDLGIASIRGK